MSPKRGGEAGALAKHRPRQAHPNTGVPATYRGPQRVSDLVPAGVLLVPVLRELFTRTDELEDGDE